MGANLVGPGGRVEVDNDLGDPLLVEVVGGVSVGTVEVTNDQGSPLPVSGTVALDATTLAALESITALIGNFPADYPDAALLAKLESVRALLAATLTVQGSVSVTNHPSSISVSNFPATQPVSGTVTATGPLTDAQLRASNVGVTVGNFPATQPVSGTVAVSSAPDPASPFARLLKFEPAAGEEIRRDETATDDYHGAAPDGTATSAASWRVARFYKTGGLITRVRYRTGVAWDSRTAGW